MGPFPSPFSLCAGGLFLSRRGKAVELRAPHSHQEEGWLLGTYFPARRRARAWCGRTKHLETFQELGKVTIVTTFLLLPPSPVPTPLRPSPCPSSKIFPPLFSFLCSWMHSCPPTGPGSRLLRVRKMRLKLLPDVRFAPAAISAWGAQTKTTDDQSCVKLEAFLSRDSFLLAARYGLSLSPPTLPTPLPPGISIRRRGALRAPCAPLTPMPGLRRVNRRCFPRVRGGSEPLGAGSPRQRSRPRGAKQL